MTTTNTYGSVPITSNVASLNPAQAIASVLDTTLCENFIYL